MSAEKCYNCGGSATAKFFFVPKKLNGKPLYLCEVCNKIVSRNISDIAMKQALVYARQRSSGVKITKESIRLALSKDGVCPSCGGKIELRRELNRSDLDEPLRVVTKAICVECDNWGSTIAVKRAHAERM